MQSQREQTDVKKNRNGNTRDERLAEFQVNHVLVE
jgi:hypothetical protein